MAPGLCGGNRLSDGNWLHPQLLTHEFKRHFIAGAWASSIGAKPAMNDFCQDVRFRFAVGPNNVYELFNEISDMRLAIGEYLYPARRDTRRLFPIGQL